MPLVTSPSQARAPGVYTILQQAPRVVRGISLGYLAYVGQFDAGPVGVGVLPADGNDLVQTFEPRGVPRHKTGWYGIIGQLGAPWFIVRVCGGTAGIGAPTQITATVTGTPGAATVSYVVTSVNANGETISSQTITVTTANATLSSSPVQLAWAAVTGATGYSVYRPVGGPSQGKIATAQAGITLTDNGIAASGSAPATNGSGFVAAQYEQYASGGSIVAVAKSPGVWGNALTWQIKAATNGDATKRDLIFTITDTITKTTTETYTNVALNQGMTALLTNSRLLASLTWYGTLAAWPASATVTLGGGSDGSTPGASDYNAAITTACLNKQVRVLVADDMGDSARAATNADLIAACADTGERVTFITGNKGNTLAQALTDKTSYTSELATYAGAWVQVFDDSGTNLVDVPFSIFLAVIRINIPVNFSVSFRDPSITKYLGAIQGLGLGALAPYSTASKSAQDQSTDAQIVQPIQGVAQAGAQVGPWQVLHGRHCNLSFASLWEVDVWYTIYVELSLTPALDPYTNGPNDFDSLREEQGLVNNFFEGEVKAKHIVPGKDANGVAFPAYSTDIDSVNSSSDTAAGNSFIAIQVHTPGVRERQFLMLEIGSTVTVRIKPRQ